MKGVKSRRMEKKSSSNGNNKNSRPFIHCQPVFQLFALLLTFCSRSPVVSPLLSLSALSFFHPGLKYEEEENKKKMRDEEGED